MDKINTSHIIARDATDAEFLEFIYERLKFVHKENPNVDYMHRMKQYFMLFQNHGEAIEKLIAERSIANQRKTIAKQNGLHLSRRTMTSSLDRDCPPNKKIVTTNWELSLKGVKIAEDTSVSTGISQNLSAPAPAHIQKLYDQLIDAFIAEASNGI